MKIRYEIEESTNAVKVFYDDSVIPSLYQPNYPGGDNWNDKEEAESWAKLYIESVVNPDAPYAPSNRGELPVNKPTKEEIDAIKRKMINDYTKQVLAE